MKILIIASHPDDEVLGAGGTIAKHAARGDAVYIFIPGIGRSPDTGATPDEVQALHDTARNAARMLGAMFVDEGALSLPDNQLDTLPRLVVAQLVSDTVRRVLPDVVYTHHAHDLNVDHRRIHEAVLIATRPQGSHYPKRVLAFEVPSSTEWTFDGSFQPTVYVDVGDVFEMKLAALHLYRAEMREWPHARSRLAVEALAQWRGATVGVTRAEAFQLIREVIL